MTCQYCSVKAERTYLPSADVHINTASHHTTMRTLPIKTRPTRKRSSSFLPWFSLFCLATPLLAFLSPSSCYHRTSPLPASRVEKYPETYDTFGDAALCEETFSDLYKDSLPTWLIDRCVDSGYTHPTLVQKRALDLLLDPSPKDVVVQAQTGTGKTLSYLLPLLANVDPTRAAVQALIVVPTRELGLQVASVAKRLAAAYPNGKFLVMNILQGSQHKRQRAWAWAEPPQVVIGTPLELTQMIRHGGIRYNSVKYVVVDEVDACLSSTEQSGGAMTTTSGNPLHELLSKYLSPTYEDGRSEAEDDHSVNSLLAVAMDKSKNKHRAVKRTKTTIFASATIPQHRHFLRQCVQNQWVDQEPIYVNVSPGELLPPTLEHQYVVCSSLKTKLSALRRLVRKLSIPKALIFAEPHRPLEEMGQTLAHDLKGILWNEHCSIDKEDSVPAVVSVLRLQDSLSQRAAATEAFCRAGSQTRWMLSTDLAARGLDISDITHVIHWDLPHSADTYVHRCGRAGRFGRKGTVLSIVTPEQEFVLERLANKLCIPIRCIARQQSKKRK